MKNDIIRIENNVPDNYLIGSRDYQALLRLFTFGISSVKFDVDNIRYINDADYINSRLLNLLRLKVGFFTNEEFKDQYLREVLKVFSLIVKKKGTKQAIYDAINLYFRACRYNGDFVVEITNKDEIQPYTIKIGVTKESKDIILLEEILRYILPTGYLYEIFKYSTAKYRTNYYTQDMLTLSVIDDYNGSNLHDNSSNIFIEKLYEGTSVGPAAICSFSDGALDAPLKSLKFYIEPAQDLHGYDYPWPAGGGKNKLVLTASDIKAASGKTWTNNTLVNDGITFTILEDAAGNVTGIRANGTASAISQITISKTNISQGIYYLSGEYYSSSAFIRGVFRDANNAAISIGGSVFTDLTAGEVYREVPSNVSYINIYININSGTTVNNVVFKPMLRVSTESSAYAPSSNICPISGWTQVDGKQSGEDMTDYTPITIALGQTVYGGTLDAIAGKLVIDKAMVDLGSLTWNYNTSWASFGVFTSDSLNSTAKTFESDTKLVCSDYAQTAQNTSGNVATVAYMSEGQIQIKTDSKQIYVRDSRYTSASAFKTAMSGVQLVYPLASPTTISLTPVSVNSLLGQNNIWANTGDTSLEYLSETSGGSYIKYYNVYNNVNENYLNVLTYPSVGTINIYNGDFTVSVKDNSQTDITSEFDIDNANMFVLVHQYLKDKRVVCGTTTWELEYNDSDNIITASSTGFDTVTIDYDNFIRNLPFTEAEGGSEPTLPSSFSLTYENSSVSSSGFTLQDDKRTFEFNGYSGNKLIIEYAIDSQYLGKRIDNVVVYKYES